jgi:hypothetical protein
VCAKGGSIWAGTIVLIEVKKEEEAAWQYSFLISSVIPSYCWNVY